MPNIIKKLKATPTVAPTAAPVELFFELLDEAELEAGGPGGESNVEVGCPPGPRPELGEGAEGAEATVGKEAGLNWGGGAAGLIATGLLTGLLGAGEVAGEAPPGDEPWGVWAKVDGLGEFGDGGSKGDGDGDGDGDWRRPRRGK